MFALAFVLLGFMPAVNLVWVIHRLRSMQGGRRSPCGQATPGFVQLMGRAVSLNQPVQAPHTGEPCVWYRLETSKPRTGVRVTIGRSRVRDDFVRVVDVSKAPFFIEDETGRVLIERDSLEVETPNRLSNIEFRGPLDRSEKLVGEYVIREGDAITAFGELHVEQDSVSKRVAEILKRWKQDAETMRRFDANQDGQVDPKEWDAARAAALSQAQGSSGRETPVRVLARPRDGRAFIVSTLPIRELRAGLERQAWVSGGLMSLSWAIALWARLGR
ncbi:MAG: hypothetical protein JNJ54_33195 [Myxococcaceae bacterium]|nr:hypothetical protein [Myxococcaceae bacterium]